MAQESGLFVGQAVAVRAVVGHATIVTASGDLGVGPKRIQYDGPSPVVGEPLAVLLLAGSPAAVLEPQPAGLRPVGHQSHLDLRGGGGGGTDTERPGHHQAPAAV